MLLKELTTAILLFAIARPALALSPCHIDGKIIYTRECMRQPLEQIPPDLHQRQIQAISSEPIGGAPTQTPADSVLRQPDSTPQVSSESTAPAQDRVNITPECSSQTLFEAARNDIVHRLQECIGTHDIRTLSNATGRTLLHEAAYYGSARSIAYLLTQNIPLESHSRGDMGATPLQLAADRNRTAVIGILLQAGADLEARDYLKRTALHRANARHATEAASHLIALGADLDSRDRAKQTPLLVASQQPNARALLASLIDAGAQIDPVNHRDMTALHYAALTDTASTKLLLSRGIALDTQDNLGRTPVLLAALDDIPTHWDRIKLLVEAGANLNTQDNEGNTLLKLAYGRQHEALLKLLLQHGVDSRNVVRVIEQYSKSRN